VAKATGGNKLAGFLNKLRNKFGDKLVVRTGYLEGRTYPDGKPVAMVAAFQEYGTPNARFPIPPRPTLRPMAENGKKTWGPMMGKALIANNYNGKAALDAMGAIMKNDLQKRIRDMNAPAISQVTLMLRGMKRRNPSLKVTRRTVYQAIAKVRAGEPHGSGNTALLRDTKFMYQSIDWEVVTKK
jgi:hypothetical protein